MSVAGDVRVRAHVVRLMRPLWPLVLAAAVSGIVGGLATAGLLATVNRALHANVEALGSLLLLFAGLCAVALVGTVLSDMANNVVGQRMIAALRRELTGKVLAASLAQVERVPRHRLIASLTEDVDAISDFAFLSARLLIALVVISGALAYLATLSLPLSALSLLMILAGAVAVAVARKRAVRRFRSAREWEDALQGHYRAITEGAKELRLNPARRHQVYWDGIVTTVQRIGRLQIQGVSFFVAANAFGSLLFFLVIGLVLIVQHRSAALDSAATTGFVLVLLYLKGPMGQLAAALPLLGRAQVSFRKLTELSEMFDGDRDPMADTPQPVPAFGALNLCGVRYRFPAGAKGEAAFELGPLDLTVRRNETLFIVGENGSGKTTLIKLLLGLYAPQAGEVRLDDRVVTDNQRDGYRQLFSAVFFDYFLFEDFTPEQRTMGADAQLHLRRLGLAHKVAVTERGVSTSGLSAGERKRLALTQAQLEHRPVLVLDEWAAEQDPSFRRLFYRELLPELKRQGKTLVVISHDDRYFDAADRIVHLENGRIVEEQKPAHAATAS